MRFVFYEIGDVVLGDGVSGTLADDLEAAVRAATKYYAGPGRPLRTWYDTVLPVPEGTVWVRHRTAAPIQSWRSGSSVEWRSAVETQFLGRGGKPISDWLLEVRPDGTRLTACSSVEVIEAPGADEAACAIPPGSLRCVEVELPVIAPGVSAAIYDAVDGEPQGGMVGVLRRLLAFLSDKDETGKGVARVLRAQETLTFFIQEERRG